MSSKLKIILLTTAVFFILLTIGSVAFAQGSDNLVDPANIDEQNEAFVGEAGLKNQKLGVVISYIIKAVLSILGVIFIVLLIYAGLLWLTSAGNEEKISKAKNIMAGAFIGLVICLSAYAITIFIIDKLVLGLTTEYTRDGDGTYLELWDD